MSEIDFASLERKRERELAQCDTLVEAVREFIKDHIEEHGPDVRYSDAVSMVSLSLMCSPRIPKRGE